MYIGLLGRVDDFVLRRRSGVVSVRDVLCYGPVEEHRLLRHEAEASSHFVYAQLLDGETV